MKFNLAVELGNEAMQTGADVAELLERLQPILADMHSSEMVASGSLRDLNGNRVGFWNIA